MRSTRAPGNAPTAPSMSRTTGGDAIGVSRVPDPIALKMAGQQPEERAKHPIAHINRVPGERKARAEIGLDLRVGPTGNIVTQPEFQRIGKVMEPAHEVKIERARLRVPEADVFIDEHSCLYKAKVVSN